MIFLRGIRKNNSQKRIINAISRFAFKILFGKPLSPYAWDVLMRKLGSSRLELGPHSSMKQKQHFYYLPFIVLRLGSYHFSWVLAIECCGKRRADVPNLMQILQI